MKISKKIQKQKSIKKIHKRVKKIVKTPAILMSQIFKILRFLSENLLAFSRNKKISRFG